MLRHAGKDLDELCCHSQSESGSLEVVNCGVESIARQAPISKRAVAETNSCSLICDDCAWFSEEDFCWWCGKPNQHRLVCAVRRTVPMKRDSHRIFSVRLADSVVFFRVHAPPKSAGLVNCGGSSLRSSVEKLRLL